MKEENFALLQQSFNEVLEHIEGKRHDLRTTIIAVPREPKPRSKKKIVALRRKLNYSQRKQ